MIHKPLKVAAVKTFFPSVCAIGTTCYSECLLFPVITARQAFRKSLSLL